MDTIGIGREYAQLVTPLRHWPLQLKLGAMSGEPNVPFGMALIVYLTWTVIFIIGHVRDFFAQFAFWAPRKDRSGYAPLRQDYEDFYTRRAYYRLVDCFARPVAGPPDRLMDVVIRSAPKKQQYLKNTGEIRKCINLGSYNYLGFANQVRKRCAWPFTVHARTLPLAIGAAWCHADAIEY